MPVRLGPVDIPEALIRAYSITRTGIGKAERSAHVLSTSG